MDPTNIWTDATFSRSAGCTVKIQCKHFAAFIDRYTNNMSIDVQVRD